MSIILGLFLDRIFCHLHDLRDMTWFEFYTQSILRITGKRMPPLQFIFILALPILLLLSIQIFLYNFLFNLPGFIFGIVVFIYCLGPACLSSDIEAYIHARTLGDDDEALHYAGTITNSAASTSPDQQTSDVTRAILSIANERIFSVIFWFVILGPFGAMLYRLISQLSKQADYQELAEFSEFIHSFMAWIPARMLAAGYALTGNFDGAYHAYKDRTVNTDFSHSNDEVLVATGLGAMRNLEAENELAGIYAAQALVMRAVIVWIGILAVMTLGGIFN
ncbi:MAG TPA: regulatory signaling modulator protein AmpE [Gammaproteobacteria bacterium]|nr:regulatory signaling modulator protein AmpE [Gammaproteobacteria bacterium]